MKKFFTSDVLIIGGGAAGLFAAIRLSELNPEIKICIVERRIFDVAVALRRELMR